MLLCSIAYYEKKKSLLGTLDNKLEETIFVVKKLFPKNYHDLLENEHYYTKIEYKKVIERYNKICKKLKLQYLWSVVQEKNGIIRFTSSTSTSKKVENGDHALFWDIHSDPDAFSETFQNMKPTYSSFKNEWGHGRMLLVPGIDKFGRKYAFGVSNSFKAIEEILLKFLFVEFIKFLLSFLFLGLFGIYVLEKIISPVELLAFTVNKASRDEDFEPDQKF